MILQGHPSCLHCSKFQYSFSQYNETIESDSAIFIIYKIVHTMLKHTVDFYVVKESSIDVLVDICRI